MNCEQSFLTVGVLCGLQLDLCRWGSRKPQFQESARSQTKENRGSLRSAPAYDSRCRAQGKPATAGCIQVGRVTGAEYIFCLKYSWLLCWRCFKLVLYEFSEHFGLAVVAGMIQFFQPVTFLQDEGRKTVGTGMMHKP